LYAFASDYARAQRGSSATPCRSGYGDTSIHGPLWLGLVILAASPGPGLPDVPPFFFPTYKSTSASFPDNRLDGRKSFAMPDSPPQPTAAAGTYRYTCRTGLGAAESSPRRQAASAGPSSSLPLFDSFLWGNCNPWARPKYFFYSAQPPSDRRHFDFLLHHQPASLYANSCLYIAGLPLCCRPTILE
jgi:hypothetical protein